MSGNKLGVLIIIGLLISTLSISNASAEETELTIKSFDGYALQAKLNQPNPTVSHLIIPIHGSGPQSMDEDLTPVTKNKQPNPFFKDLSESLAAKGFAVLRYNKRSYQVSQAIAAQPDYVQSKAYKDFAAAPLRHFLEDALAVVQFAADRFPNVKLYLLGHSQGAYIAVQAAQRLRDSGHLDGVALIGFHLSTLDTLVFEQTIYRPLHHFTKLDANHDERLTDTELANGNPIGHALAAQKPLLDLDGDGCISLSEFQAGNASNLLLRDPMDIAYRQEEAQMDRLAAILPTLTMKVAFLQGLWDNQTPAYNAQAVEIANKAVWKKPYFKFWYYPKRGHALDSRDSYNDLYYSPLDAATKQDVAQKLSDFFMEKPSQEPVRLR